MLSIIECLYAYILVFLCSLKRFFFCHLCVCVCVCVCIYKYIYKHMCVYIYTAKSLQSCPTLCDPIDGSPPGSPIPGILQARTLEWVAISFSSAWKWKVKVKLLSRVWFAVTPWTTAHRAPPSMGFSRQEYLNGVPLPSLVCIYKLGYGCFTICVSFCCEWISYMDTYIPSFLVLPLPHPTPSYPSRSPRITNLSSLCITLAIYFTHQSVQLLSGVWLFATPWTTAHQASLSNTNSQSLPKPMSINLVMPSNHFILCRPFLLLPSIFPSITVFSN